MKLTQGAVSIRPRTPSRIFTVRAGSDVLAAALAINAPVFGMRLSNTNSWDAHILRIYAAFTWVVAATAAQQFQFYMQRFSAANLAGGAASTPLLHDADQGASNMQDIRRSTTAALTSVGVTFDGAGVPILGWTAAAIGTGAPDMLPVFDHLSEGPITLRANEGLCIRNLVAWPAAGTGVFRCEVTWEEERT